MQHELHTRCHVFEVQQEEVTESTNRNQWHELQAVTVFRAKHVWVTPAWKNT